MKIKLNYSAISFLIGMIVLVLGFIFFFVSGQSSATVDDMFGQNGAVTIWGFILVGVGVVLNVFACRKA